MIAFIVLCLGLGWLLRLSGKFPANSPQVFNGFILYVSFPALVLLQIPDLVKSLTLSAGLLVPVSMAWIQFGLAFVLFSWLGRKYHWNDAKTGALVLCAGLGNTSFVGFPLLESLLGPDSIRYGVLVDQPGSFLTLSTVALIYATAKSPIGSRRPSAKEICRRIFTFPPFVLLLLAAAWGLGGGSVEGTWRTHLERLSHTLVPIALISVGFQLSLSPAVLRRQAIPLTGGLVFKLFIAPAFFTGLYVYLFRAGGTLTRVTLLESAMAPMITAAIVAEEFGFDTEIANLMIGLGIPISLVTVPLWNGFWRNV